MKKVKKFLAMFSLLLFVFLTGCEDMTVEEMGDSLVIATDPGGDNNHGTGSEPPPDTLDE